MLRRTVALSTLVTCWTIALAPSSVVGQSPASAEALRFFESKVRPIFAEKCFRCHGPEKQKGHLRVDSRTALLTGGDLGPAIVTGDPEKSLLIKALRHVDDDLKMPPSGKLAAEQIADISRWITMGAPWPGDDKSPAPKAARKGEKEITDKDRQHWAFQPIRRPAAPAVKNTAWVANPIDAFILAGLEAKSLSPNPPAGRGELLRRATFNVTGLPPTPAEVEAFLKDPSEKAYQALVERLLQSSHYGEKWARHWLDIVRYADTNSYERDNPKPNIWRYRDYVIRSLNDDKPFDRFVKEQLAGDEMSNPGPDQYIATGFYRLGIWDDEPSDRIQARYDGLDDIVTTVGQGMLGLTLDCARCHDHKIDPVLQRDYYRFMAFFHNINHYRNGGPTDEMPIFATPGAKDALAQEKKRLDERRKVVEARIAAIEAEFQAGAKKSTGIVATKSDLEDIKYRYYRDSWDRLPDFDALKFEDSGKLKRDYFDLAPRTRNTEFGFVFEASLIVPKTGAYVFHLDSDDGSRLLVDGKKIAEHDGIHGVGNEKTGTLSLDAGRHPIRLEYFQKHNGYGLYVAWSGPGFSRRMLSVPPDAKNASPDFNQFFTKTAPEVLGKPRLAEYQKLKKELASLKDPLAASTERALIVTEPGSHGPDTFVFLRGNPSVPGTKVEPGFPTVLHLPDPTIPETKGARSSGRRTALANWIASPDNPLTARVIVNRLWQHHFGRGIVRSPNNFGYQGDRPTHPELLDWLAAELVEHGWSLKHIHRLIMTSNAYRMSSRGRPEALKADPTNDLFWRFDMRRLSAEEVRDSILAVSGNLNPAMYGPGIYPEIPPEVLAGQSAPGRGWPKSSPEDQARRSVYVHVKRSLLLPILDSFDLAETDRTTATRFASTQPTQALMMLNSTFINRQAETFAARLRREAGDDVAAQVRRGLYLATSRQPSADDVRRGVELIVELRREEGSNAEDALRYFCLMALNLNEFMYLD
jgi:cytochrome c553